MPWQPTQEQRRKGFIRPPRRSYLHRDCGTVSTLDIPTSELMAINPSSLPKLMCDHCKDAFYADQFTWMDDETVGS